LGWFNGIILGLYFLFFTKHKNLPNRLFGFLLLVLSFRISKSVIWYFYPDVPILFVQTGLAVCFFIGPLLLLYLQYSTQESKQLSRLAKGALLACVVFVAVLLVFFTSDTHLVLWKKYFVRVIYGQWFLTVLVSGFFIRKILKKTAQSPLKISETLSATEKWLLAVYAGNLMLVTTYVVSYFNILDVAYITGAVAFSLILYLNVTILLYRKKTDDLFGNVAQKYQNKKIHENEAVTLAGKLNEVLNAQEAYKNSDLKLGDLAQMLGISSHQLSQLLNDNLNKSFSNYLNEFRIRKACELITSDADLKIEAIGYEVGYNSKSTFFAAFRKITGTTPSLYKSTLTANP
jgi:AraC-like DNA-binding protein